jgi:hypothetical protein
MKSSVLVNCPWGSAFPSRVAPVHFQSPIGSLVSGLHVRAPFQVPRGPPARGSVFREVSCHPVEPPWGSARSSREAPIHLGPQFTARFQAPHVHMLGPRLLLKKMKGSSFQVRKQGSARCHPPARSLPRSPLISLSTHVQLNVPDIPMLSCCARRQLE